VVGPGFCGQVVDGAIGTATFAWPTPGRSISGYGFSSFHPAIDIGGAIGNAIYASDTGVVVYAGWNTYGYGNLVIIDHGTGWQSLYAHLDRIDVGCGQSIFQGSQIGTMGITGNSSGPHLHFELQSDSYGKVNPSNFLP
jgi:murein DD-endopeptidase MepM/ murein hydrolase activator NlpD